MIPISPNWDSLSAVISGTPHVLHIKKPKGFWKFPSSNFMIECYEIPDQVIIDKMYYTLGFKFILN